MKRWIGVALLVFVGAVGWRIGDTLSPDALSMAAGILLGVLAGVPTALLIMAGSRRHLEDRSVETHWRRQQLQEVQMNGPLHGPINRYGLPAAQQPPIIIVAGPQALGNTPQLPPPSVGWIAQDAPTRHFTVVGDSDGFVDEW